MEENEEEEARLFSVVLIDRTRVNKHKLKYIKFHLNTRNFYLFFFYNEGDQTLAQAAQRGC